MKLYTEEQVNSKLEFLMQSLFGDDFRMTVHDSTLNRFQQAMELELTPIELPSDEEIENYIEKTYYGEKKHYFKAGVMFIKQQILNQNK